MGHAGFLSHEDTVDSMTLFGKEVLPRLKALQQPDAPALSGAAAAARLGLSEITVAGRAP